MTQTKTGIDRFAGKGQQTSIRVRQERANQWTLDLVPIIDEIRADSATTLKAIADALNARGFTASRGGAL